MKSFIALTFLTACVFATAIAYDCPELAKDFYGNDIVCGYGLASDWKTCGKTIFCINKSWQCPNHTREYLDF